MATTNIYVLRCEYHHYWVGHTDTLKDTFEEYAKECNSEFTQRYKPISLEKVIPNVEMAEVDKVVKEYMRAHGTMMVRGGSYPDDFIPNLQELLHEFGYDMEGSDCSCCSSHRIDTESDSDSGCDSE